MPKLRLAPAGLEVLIWISGDWEGVISRFNGTPSVWLWLSLCVSLFLCFTEHRYFTVLSLVLVRKWYLWIGPAHMLRFDPVESCGFTYKPFRNQLLTVKWVNTVSGMSQPQANCREKPCLNCLSNHITLHSHEAHRNRSFGRLWIYLFGIQVPQRHLGKDISYQYAIVYDLWNVFVDKNPQCEWQAHMLLWAGMSCLNGDAWDAFSKFQIESSAVWFETTSHSPCPSNNKQCCILPSPLTSLCQHDLS